MACTPVRAVAEAGRPAVTPRHFIEGAPRNCGAETMTAAGLAARYAPNPEGGAN